MYSSFLKAEGLALFSNIYEEDGSLGLDSFKPVVIRNAEVFMDNLEAWARGSAWTDLISNTSLDEGDVVRILRRTNDLLSQIPYCEAVSRQLRNNAKAAMKLMDRYEVFLSKKKRDFFLESLQ